MAYELRHTCTTHLAVRGVEDIRGMRSEFHESLPKCVAIALFGLYRAGGSRPDCMHGHVCMPDKSPNHGNIDVEGTTTPLAYPENAVTTIEWRVKIVFYVHMILTRVGESPGRKPLHTIHIHYQVVERRLLPL